MGQRVEILIVSTQTVERVHQIIEAKWNKLFLGNRRDETEREDQMSKIKIRKWFVIGGEKQVEKKGSTYIFTRKQLSLGKKDKVSPSFN